MLKVMAAATSQKQIIPKAPSFIVMDILIFITTYPYNGPKLHAFYLMNKDLFNTRYSPIFKLPETVMIPIELHYHKHDRTTGYSMEIYLPDTEIQVIENLHMINSYKVLLKERYFGNLDIIFFIDRNYRYFKDKLAAEAILNMASSNLSGSETEDIDSISDGSSKSPIPPGLSPSGKRLKKEEI